MRRTILFVLMIMLLGCANEPNLYMDGREVPNVYTLSSLTNEGLTANFVCVLGIGETDADGSLVAQPTYLMADVLREVRLAKTEAVHFQMAVFNPRTIKYVFYEEYTITYKDGNEIFGQGIAGFSNLENREFYRRLPVDITIDRVRYRVILKSEDGKELLRAGDFVYRLL